VDGVPIKNTHFNSDGSSFSYTTYYFSPSVYEQAFQKTGFKHFEWVSMAGKSDIENYDDYIKEPIILGILAPVV
jgi:hypothetical protein